MSRAIKRHFATKLVVRNLSPNTTAESLHAMFEDYGTVSSVRMMTDVMTGRCSGVAFVTLAEHVIGAAVAALDSSHQSGRIIRVSLERKPLPAADHGDRRGAR